MGRQRTVNDHGFWHSPLLQGCTTEDKVALLHLLTCPSSNVIGAYSLMPKIAAVEIGWSPDQWLQVVDRLRAEDLVWFEPLRMFVWVRVWWHHNQASQTLGPKLRSRTLENIKLLPEAWREPFLEAYKARLSEEHRQLLDALLGGHCPAEVPSVPYGYGIDRSSDFGCPNANAKTNFNVTPTLAGPAASSVDKSGIPEASQAVVLEAIAKAQRRGVAKADTQTILEAVGKQFQCGRPLKDPAAYAYAVAEGLTLTDRHSPLPSPASSDELAVWQGRCFCWPSGAPTNFIQIQADGQYVQHIVGEDIAKPRYGRLGQSPLLEALRAGKVREVTAETFLNLIQGRQP